MANTHKSMRVKIMHNIGILFVRMGQVQNVYHFLVDLPFNYDRSYLVTTLDIKKVRIFFHAAFATLSNTNKAEKSSQLADV